MIPADLPTDTLDLHFQFLQHLVQHLEKKEIPRPVVLIVDGHTSRLTLGNRVLYFSIFSFAGAVEYCETQNIQLVLEPPHSSHVMQPNDLILNRQEILCPFLVNYYFCP